MVGGLSAVEQQSRRLSDVENQNVHFPVIINVSERGPATGLWGQLVEPRQRGDVFKRTVAIVAVEHNRLLVSDTAFYVVHLRIDVAVDLKNIKPAFIREIDEPCAPSHQRRGGLGDAGLPSNIHESLLALVPVKRVGFVDKVGDE